jgi:hypothetical protein
LSSQEILKEYFKYNTIKNKGKVSPEKNKNNIKPIKKEHLINDIQEQPTLFKKSNSNTNNELKNSIENMTEPKKKGSNLKETPNIKDLKQNIDKMEREKTV